MKFTLAMTLDNEDARDESGAISYRALVSYLESVLDDLRDEKSAGVVRDARDAPIGLWSVHA